MSKVFLQMWGLQRKYIIDSHLFYFEQAKAKLLPAFNNIEEEAEKYADTWAEERSQEYYDPDANPAEIYDQANDQMVDYLINLDELHKNVLFSITAGMYHKWQKELREWIINQMRHLKGYEQLRKKVWLLNIGQIFDLFKDFSWNVYSENFFEKLDICRLIVNVYKHGNGKSFEELKQKYPQYVVDPLVLNSTNSTKLAYLDHTNVKLTDEDLEIFADAITGFWEEIPETIDQEKVINIPMWLQQILK